MPKDRIAEGLLVLVTSRERAASIVGDLMEGSATRGRVWWWSAVLRAVASLLWGGFADSPRGMLGLALVSWLMRLLLVAASIILFSVLGGDVPKTPGINQQTYDMAVFACIIGAPGQFLVGCWIARRASGRALSAWLAVLIMDQVLSALISIVGHWPWQPLNWMSGLTYLLCLAGTIWVRERAVT